MASRQRKARRPQRPVGLVSRGCMVVMLPVFLRANLQALLLSSDLHRGEAVGTAASQRERAGPMVRRLLGAALELRPASTARAHAAFGSATAVLKSLSLAGPMEDDDDHATAAENSSSSSSSRGNGDGGGAGSGSISGSTSGSDDSLCFFLNLYHLLLQHAFLVLGAPRAGLVHWHRFHQVCEG